MLDSFQIFTKGGLILFQWSLMDVPKGSPVDELVKQCLLEERAGETEFTHVAGSSAYTLRWRTHNALGLVFVAVYQKILRLDYVDDLLDRCRDAFAEAYDPSSAKLAYPEFTETFTATLREEEARANARRAPKERAPRAFDAAKKAAIAQRRERRGARRRTTAPTTNATPARLTPSVRRTPQKARFRTTPARSICPRSARL